MTEEEFAAAMHGYKTLIPAYMIDGLERYVVHRVRPGDFLYAVLCNDLMLAFVKADDNNTEMMKGWVMVLHNALYPHMYGSKDIVDAYIKGEDV